MNTETLVGIIETLAPEMEVTVNEVHKGNVILTGISIGTGNLRPVVYMEHFEEKYKAVGYFAVAIEMIIICKNAMQNQLANRNLDEIASWKYAMNNLRICISPKGTNPDCIVYPYLDLELYIRVIVSNENGELGSYKVKTEMLKTWNMTPTELLMFAAKCTESLIEIAPLGEVMYEMTRETDYLCDTPLLLATVEDKMYGASILYFKDLLKEFADVVESDVIIIPSSINECLLAPVDGIPMEELRLLINQANETVVSPEEVLSNHAYVFHRDTMEITW